MNDRDMSEMKDHDVSTISGLVATVLTIASLSLALCMWAWQ